MSHPAILQLKGRAALADGSYFIHYYIKCGVGTGKFGKKPGRSRGKFGKETGRKREIKPS